MPVIQIDPAELRAKTAAGESLDLLDVRTPAEFAEVHAVGARLMPIDELDPAKIQASRVAGKPLYVLCQSGGRAAKACERLADAGLTDVFCVDGGTAAWERAGLPVTRGGGKVISLERQVRIAAGSLVLVGAALGWLIHPAFFGLSAFVGAGLVFAGVTDFCGMGILLAKLPWNRHASNDCSPRP